MSGDRHHYLPRFLLKGFAIDPSSKKPRVWMLRRGDVPVEVSTRNVGVSQKFYESAEDEEIDDKITKMETVFAPALNRLRLETENCDVKDSLLPDLVCHLSIRTKHLRDSLASTTNFLQRGMQDYISDTANLRPLMQTYLRNHPEFIQEQVDKACEGQSLTGRKRKWLVRKWKKMAGGRIKSDIEEAKTLVSGFRTVLEIGLKDVAAKGQLGALSRSIVPEPRAAMYRALTWNLKVTEDDLILADCGPVHFERGGRCRPIPNKPADVEAVFLPVSSRHLLVGSVHSGRQQIGVDELNQTSARCSREFLVGCRKGLVEHYVSYLAQSGSLFEPDELEVMLEEIISALAD